MSNMCNNVPDTLFEGPGDMRPCTVFDEKGGTEPLPERVDTLTE
jgi:hypothetical protein